MAQAFKGVWMTFSPGTKQKGDVLFNTTGLPTFHWSRSAHVKAISISKEKATVSKQMFKIEGLESWPLPRHSCLRFWKALNTKHESCPGPFSALRVKTECGMKFHFFFFLFLPSLRLKSEKSPRTREENIGGGAGEKKVDVLMPWVEVMPRIRRVWIWGGGAIP